MKKIHLLCIGLMSLLSLAAQETFTYSNPARSFQEGKEQYLQQQYAASIHNLKAFLQTADPLDKSRIEEARYYIASSAFELREPDAADLLTSCLNEYEGTPMADNIKYRLGVLEFENKQYKTAIQQLSEVDVSRLKPSETEQYHFATGYCYIVTSKPEKALPEFQQLLASEKYGNIADYYYGYCEYALGNYDNALPYFQKIEKETEFSALAPYYILQIYKYKKQYDNVKSYGRQILADQPDNEKNSEVYRILGEIAYQEKNYPQSSTYFEKSYKVNKTMPRSSSYMWGMSALNNGNSAQAVTALSRVAGSNDALGQNAYLALGNAYIKENDKLKAQMAYANAGKLTFDKSVQEEALYNYALVSSESGSPFGESIKAFDNFLVTFPNSAHSEEISSRLATAFIVSKDYPSALNAINKIKTTNPQLDAAKENILFHLGVEQFDRKNYSEAVSYFTQAINVTNGSPNMVQLYYWRGESYYRAGQFNLAQIDFTAYQNDPRSSKDANYKLSNYALGYCYFNTQNFKQSQLYFLRFAGSEHEALSPVYIDALVRIGDCLFYARDFVNARRYYSQVVAKDRPQSDYAQFQMAFIDGLQKNYQTKIIEMQKLIDNFPSSDYCDDAYYEIGRSYIIMEQYDKAIDTYSTLIQKYPNSPYSRKAALETGLAYSNKNDKQKAIDAYKSVVKNFPGSTEATVALENIETTYMDMGDAQSYLAYRRSLGKGDISLNAEDSIVYITAEKLYINGNYSEAANQLNGYLTTYCPQGNYCIKATFCLADSYMKTGNTDKALENYRKLAAIKGNPYYEESLVQCASITYDKKDYVISLQYFKQLAAITTNSDYREAARLGVLRCSHLSGDYSSAIAAADAILKNSDASPDVITEARYYRAKACLSLNQPDNALNDLKTVSKNLRSAFGAEAKYLLAGYYYQKNDLAQAEAESLDFIKNDTPYQFWLAKTFILLSDIYVKRGDDFQARQYLITLRDNYKQQDEIQDIIKQKLQPIDERLSKSTP